MKREHQFVTSTNILAAMLFVACGGPNNSHAPVFGAGSSALQGRVTSDGNGSGSSSFDSGATLQNVASVQVGSLDGSGNVQVISSSTIDASGRYVLPVPSNTEKLIVQAVDRQHNVLASAVVESSGSANSTIAVTPITTRTSVEAAVMTRMVMQGTELADIDTVSLYQRISADVAALMRSSAEGGADVESQLQALASASTSAQTATLQTDAQAGITTTNAALFQAKLPAALSVAAKLDASSETEAETDSDLQVQVDAILTSLGLSAKVQALATTTSSAAFRGLIQANLGATASDQSLIDAAARAEASLEAHAANVATVSLLTTAGASQDVISNAVTAGSMLESQVNMATTANAAAQAFATFQASLAASTQSSLNASILGQLLSATVTNQTVASADLQAMVNAEAQAHATLTTSLQAVFSSVGQVSVNAAAHTAVTAYGAFDSAVDAAIALLLPDATTTASASANVLVLANGAFIVTQ